MQMAWISIFAITGFLLIAGAAVVLTARFLIRNRPAPTGKKYFWDE
jgi:hypothetical protein